MSTGKTFQLNTGAKIPAVGLGTWRSDPTDVYNAVIQALKVGYRHIDTAFGYGNEVEIGKAIRESGVPRKDIFLTTKLWPSFASRAELQLEKSYANLGYVDLWLMHWPFSMNPKGNDTMMPKLPDGSRDFEDEWDFVKTWKTMEEAIVKYPDKVKAIGVSNFSTVNLDILLANAKIIPAMNQVELHPYLTQEKLYNYCQKHHISLSGYSPLGSLDSPLHDEPTLTEVAKRNNITPAQVMISWAAARWAVLPKSVTPSRIEENFHLVDLSQEDMAKIDGIKTTKRFISPPWGRPVFHDDE